MAMLKTIDGDNICEYQNVYDLEFIIKNRQISLTRADLSYIDIEGVDFRGYNLENANFKGADASNCNFDGANMRNTDLTDACFDKSLFRNVTLDNAIAEDASFKDCSFRKARFLEAKFKDCDFTSVNFEGATLFKAEFEKCNLSMANLRFTKLESTPFVKCKFPYAVGDGRYISSITFYPFHVVIVHASNFHPDGRDDLLCIGTMQYKYNDYMRMLAETEGQRLCADGYKVYDYYYGLINGLHKYMLNIDSADEQAFVERYMQDFRSKWGELARTGGFISDPQQPMSAQLGLTPKLPKPTPEDIDGTI